MMKKLDLVLSIALVIGMVLAVSCGGVAPAPTATVTVTKTAPSTPGVAATVTMTATVTTTAPAGTVTVTPTPTPRKLVKVKTVEATGGLSALLATVTKGRGIFEKRGIDLVMEEAAAGISKVAAFTGQADIGNGDIIQYYPERKDARFIGPYYTAFASLLVRKDSPYRSYRDLVGKKIGTLGKATIAHWGGAVVAKMEGVDLEKDLTVLSGDSMVLVGWLLKGEVDAIQIAEPYTSKLLATEGDKVRELYWLNDAFKKYSGSSWLFGIYAPDAWVKANPDLAREVGLAYDDLLRYMQADDGVWKSDIAKKFWKIENPAVLEMLVQRMPRILERLPYGPAFKATVIKKTQFVADTGLVPQDTVEWIKGAILFADPW